MSSMNAASNLSNKGEVGRDDRLSKMQLLVEKQIHQPPLVAQNAQPQGLVSKGCSLK